MAARRTINPYNIIRVPYSLRWPEEGLRHGRTRGREEGELDQQAIPALNLPTPEATEEWGSISRYLAGAAAEAKSGFGQFVRFVKRTPPYIWVINQHDEDITVMVNRDHIA